MHGIYVLFALAPVVRIDFLLLYPRRYHVHVRLHRFSYSLRSNDQIITFIWPSDAIIFTGGCLGCRSICGRIDIGCCILLPHYKPLLSYSATPIYIAVQRCGLFLLRHLPFDRINIGVDFYAGARGHHHRTGHIISVNLNNGTINWHRIALSISQHHQCRPLTLFDKIWSIFLCKSSFCCSRKANILLYWSFPLDVLHNSSCWRIRTSLRWNSLQSTSHFSQICFGNGSSSYIWFHSIEIDKWTNRKKKNKNKNQSQSVVVKAKFNVRRSRIGIH